MLKKYTLTSLLFLCLTFVGFGQVSENFDGLSQSSYGNYLYNGFQITNGLCNVTNSLSGNAVRLRNANTSLEYVGGDGNGKDNGVGDISFWYRAWDNSPTAIYIVEISINNGTYTQIGSQINTNSTTYAQWTYSLNNSSDNIKIRVSRTSGERLHIDDFSITDYSSCTPPADPIGSISGTTPACSATTLSYTYGTGEPLAGIDYYWQTAANGTDLSNNASATFNANTTGTYYVRAYDSGATCWSANAVSYAVTINSLPTISAQPTDQSEVIPDTATFSVTASGDPAPTYQWQVPTDNGATWNDVTDGSGATTDTYTTAATTTAMHNYQYQCVVTNTCGNITSDAATLTLSNDSPNNATGIDECLDDNSITLTWNAPGSGATPDGYVVFARTGATDPFNITGNATDYNGYNSDFSLAPTASADLGRYVYKGNTTSATITGLTEDTNYSFTIYAYVGDTLTGWSSC
jgi:hypothetical protein